MSKKFKIQNTKRDRRNNSVMVVYGEAKTGKTTLIKTWGGKPLLLSIERGEQALRESDIDFLHIADADALDEVQLAIGKRCEDVTGELHVIDAVIVLADHDDVFDQQSVNLFLSLTFGPSRYPAEIGWRIGSSSSTAFLALSRL